MSIAGQTLSGSLPSNAPIAGPCPGCNGNGNGSSSPLSPPNFAALATLGVAAVIIIALMNTK
jgi:hypothetical protein